MTPAMKRLTEAAKNVVASLHEWEYSSDDLTDAKTHASWYDCSLALGEALDVVEAEEVNTKNQPDYCRLADASCRCIRASQLTYGAGIDPEHLGELFEATNILKGVVNPQVKQVGVVSMTFTATDPSGFISEVLDVIDAADKCRAKPDAIAEL